MLLGDDDCRAEATTARCGQDVTRSLWMLKAFSPALLFIQILYSTRFVSVYQRWVISSGHRPRCCDCKLTDEGYFVTHRGKESLYLQKGFLCTRSA